MNKKKYERWLKPQSLEFSLRDLNIYQTTNNLSIFYPWGFRGDSYYVSSNDVGRIVKIQRFITYLLIFLFLVSVALRLVFLDFPVFVAFVIIINFSMFIKIASLYFLVRRLSYCGIPMIHNGCAVPSYRQGLKNLFSSFSAQFLFLILSLFGSKTENLTFVTMCVICVLYFFLALIVWFKKGHFVRNAS